MPRGKAAKKRQTREQSAHHEAAHAVADLRLGLGCDEITILPDATKRTLGGAKALVHWKDVDDDGSTMEASLVALYAGLAAETRFDPGNREMARLGAENDFEEAREILERRYGSREIAAHEAEWIERAEAFVADERNWHAIEVFAGELLMLDRFYGEFAESLLEFADGETPAGEWVRIRVRLLATSNLSGSR